METKPMETKPVEAKPAAQNKWMLATLIISSVLMLLIHAGGLYFHDLYYDEMFNTTGVAPHMDERAVLRAFDTARLFIPVLGLINILVGANALKNKTLKKPVAIAGIVIGALPFLFICYILILIVGTVVSGGQLF